MTALRLVCDAGGTNIRMALSQGAGHAGEPRMVPTRDCSDLAATLEAYVTERGMRDQLASVAVAVAGPVDEGSARLTNAALSIDESQLRARLKVARVRVLNDLEAVAHAIALLKGSELPPFNAPARPLSGPRIVINVGTGFGAALLVPVSGGWETVACEPGHMTLASLMPGGRAGGHAQAVLSIEDIVSGRALAGTQDAPQSLAQPEFSRRLGSICGDLVLACGAWGGVYLCGSVALAWSRMVSEEHRAHFMAAFVRKGPMTQRMHRVAIATIAHAQPALAGLSALDIR